MNQLLRLELLKVLDCVRKRIFRKNYQLVGTLRGQPWGQQFLLVESSC